MKLTISAATSTSRMRDSDGGQVLLVDAEVGDRVLEPVLDRAEVGAGVGDDDSARSTVSICDDVHRDCRERRVDRRVTPTRFVLFDVVDRSPGWRRPGSVIVGVGAPSRAMPLNVELSRIRTSSAVSCATSAVILAWSAVRQRAVGVLDGELADALQDRVHLVQRAFRRLHERDAVLGVAAGLGGAADLGAHALRDGQAGGVVGGAVDAQAATTASPSTSTSVDLRALTRLRWALNASMFVLIRSDTASLLRRALAPPRRTAIARGRVPRRRGSPDPPVKLYAYHLKVILTAISARTPAACSGFGRGGRYAGGSGCCRAGSS